MNRSQFHRFAYVVLLCLLAVAMTTSVFATNLLWFLLLVNWVAEWNWKEKFADFRSNYLLQAFLVLMAVHLLWLVGTSNMQYALFDIRKKLPLLAIPLVILTTRPLEYKESLNVGIAYTAAVFVVSIIGFARYLTIPFLPYRDIVPYISHIRFSLNVCMTLVLLAYAALKYRRVWLYALNLLLSLWFLAFLILLHSYTAFIILFVTALVLMVCYSSHMARRMRVTAIILSIAVVLLVGGVTWRYVSDYYRLQPLAAEPLKASTANGNPYIHLNDGLIENGNYVHNYICKQELCQQWALISDYPIDSLTPLGYPVYPTLLRYLNGMGVTKDSVGMTHLTATDIQAIEQGIANPVYLKPGLRKMLYILFFENESYRCYHCVANSSLLQRFELWRNGWHVFLQHPLLGVGTGDVVDECHQQLQKSNSPLSDTKLHTHNQYLNFLLAFGLLGFGLITYFYIKAIIKGVKYGRSKEANALSTSASYHFSPFNALLLFTAFLCILFISFISEDTLETLAGITFSVMGFALLFPRKMAES